MPVTLQRGTSPLILAMPHVGTDLPDDVRAALNPRGRTLSDTDWHIDKLYQDLAPRASVVAARFHRYVIDANRGPDGASLYPGQNTTGLVPLTDFDGQDIWSEPPSADDTAQRLAVFHARYHAVLEEEIARVKALHGVAVLWDCHSIRSRIPFLFEGTLPDLNIGTNGGLSCDPRLSALIRETVAGGPFTWVENGRFKGGWTTRHYGEPARGVHAIQMEVAQSRYLSAEAPPWSYDGAKAAPLREILQEILHKISAFAPELEVTN